VLSRLSPIAAPCAVIALAACAGSRDPVQRELEAMRTEIAALRQQDEALARRIDALGARVDAAARPPKAAAPPAAPVEPPAPLVPTDLAVVRVAPPRPARAAPPIATSVPIAEPDSERVEVLAEPGGRDIAAEAEAELAAARRKRGLDRARALESFVARFPRHPSADNALLEAARDLADAGRTQAGCDLAKRVGQDYPAGDAVPGAAEFVARCERSRP
jgi:hypothetical protein